MADQNFRVKNGLSIGIGGSVVSTSIGGNVGLGSTNPTSKLWVSGDGYFTGVVTSSGFYVDGQLIGSGSVTVGPIVGTALSISGISTSAEFVGGGSDLRNLSGTHLVTYASHSETSNSALSIAGISTYTQVGILTGSLAVDANDAFGYSVATSADGKTIVVGARSDEIGATLGAGIVYVFDRIGNSFNQVGILTGSLAVDANDEFGFSVATSADGKTIVVGARSDEIGATSATGVVYVFDRIGNSFNQVGILTGSYAIDASDNFGTAVATSADGKTIIVGALSDEIGATGATGVVYVFDRIGNSFNQVGILTGSYATAISDAFGTSIATSADGKTIVVSAPSDEIGATTGTGIVYVFDRIGNSFNEVGILTGSYAIDTSDAFGTSVATSADGKTIIVGASGDEIGATTGTGVVYVFDRIGNSFNQVGILTGSLAVDASDQFGSFIATSADGKTIVVSARGDEIGATNATGVVYVFKRQANSFNQVGILTGLYAVDANDNFGQVVTISADGKTIIVATQNDEIGATTGTGIGYVFDEVRDTYVYSGPTGNIGIGSTNPTSKLWVSGDGYFVGVVTSSGFYVDGELIGSGSVTVGPIVGTALSISGISTLGTVEISSGIITSTIVGGSVTYYGDGSNLTKTVSISTNTVNQAQFLTYVAGTGSTNGFGVTTTGLLFNPFRGYLGIGTNTLTTTLNIGGVIRFTNNNIRIGDSNTGCSITSGTHNFFAGASAGRYNTSGCYNNFFGRYAGCTNTTGGYNNFFGACAGRCNTTGSDNTFIGRNVGFANTTGSNNNFIGALAGRYNTSGCHNNFFGNCTGLCNTTGRYNNFFGHYAGRSNTNAVNNTFIGKEAGYGNTTGSCNNYIGLFAGWSNTNGSSNNFFGRSSGYNSSGGRNNSFFGTYTGYNISGGCNNNFFGSYAGCSQTAGNRNVALGHNVQLPDTTGSDQLNIGSGSNSWISGNSAFNVGIGTTNPTSKLWVNGDGYFVGVVTSSGFYVDGELIGQGGISGTNLVGTALSISGISTLGTVQISSGIVTATSGVVTYYGDGSNLTGITASANVSISTNTANQSQFLTYVAGTGSTNGFGVTTTGLLFNPFRTQLGIGTNTLSTTLNIGGVIRFTNNNIRIGDSLTGPSITSGVHNFFAGSEAGRCNTTGCYNNFFGRCAGKYNTIGSRNNFFGNYAGRSNTTGCYNNFFGQGAGTLNTCGDSNNFIGRSAGYFNTSGSCNNFFGSSSGRYNTCGCHNNFLGFKGGYCNTSGCYNNFFGACAGYANTTGNFNNFLGCRAGYRNTSGSCNNFLGYWAGGSPSGGNNTGSHNNFFGTYAGEVNTSGHSNNFFGRSAGKCNTSGRYNNFFGANAGIANTTGSYNNFFGQDTGRSNTRGCFNNFLGSEAGRFNTTGGYNNFFGRGAGFANTTGCYNNFFGDNAGRCNTSGNFNNFLGCRAGFCNTTGCNNNFFGRGAGFENTTGCYNNFFGTCAGYCNTTGYSNNFFGKDAGRYNTTGSYNNFFGKYAGRCNSNSNNNFFGTCAGSYSTGSSNNFLGFKAGQYTTGNNNNFLGNNAGKCNTGGTNNNFFGSYAGRTNSSGSHNNFFGCYAGYYNSSGSNNNFLGYFSGRYNTTGTYNNFFGYFSGRYNTTGTYNNFFGFNAGLANTTGSQNNFFGLNAGRYNISGNYNNFFGYCAGATQTSGNKNIAIGYNVQLPNITGSDQLNIGSGSNSWISGNSSFNVGLGTDNPTQRLHVLGSARVTGAFYDSTNATGTSGQVLQSTETGTLWATAAAGGGGGSGTFDTGITTTTFVSVDSGIGTAITGITTVQANNDVFLGPGIALSFPNVVGNRYVIQSIHVANTFDNELYLTARHDFNNGALRVPVANRVVVPYNGALELLEQPTIANPGDILRLQALSGIGSTAGGVDGGLDAWITYSTKTDTNFVGVGTTVTTAGTNVGGISTYQTVYTSTGYPSVIQSIRIANYNLFIDVDASIAIFSSLGIRKGHLAYNLTIPKNSIVELCQQPKRLETSETIGVSVGSTTSGGANALSVCVSSKYITS